MAAFDDAISGSGNDFADFDPAPALDSLIRRTTSGLPADSPVTADMLVNRLARKMGQPRPADLEPVEVETPEKTPGTGTKGALDFSSEGVPVDSLPDLSEFGTPADQVAAPPAATPAAAPTSGWDYPAEFGKGLLEGGKNMGAASLKGVAGASIPKPADASMLDDLAGAKALTPAQRARLTTRAIREISDPALKLDFNAALTRIANGADPAVEIAALRPKFEANNLAAQTPVTESKLYKAGHAIEEFGKDALAPKPGFEPGKSWTRDIGAGAGSMAAGIVVSMIPGVGPAAAGSLFTTAGMGEATDNAVKGKATPQQTRQAAMLGGLAGATDMADTLIPMLGGTGRALGFLKRVGVAAVKGAILEGGQEGLQQFMQNAIAKGIYKPDQDLFEDVPRSMAIAAILGGAGGAVSGAARRGGSDAPAIGPAAGASPGAAGPGAGAGPTGGPQSSPEDIAESRASHDGASDTEILKAAGMSDQDIAKLDEEDRINAVIKAAKRPEASQGAGEQAQSNQKRSDAPSQDDLDYSTLRAYGYSDEDIEMMAPKQRAAEAKDAAANGIDPAEAAKKYARPEADTGTGKREAPVDITSAADVDAVTRPAAEIEYSHAQGEANNRQLGHGKWNGLPISMEVAKGGVRKMVNPKTGEPVEVTHGGAAYGYFKGTKGADDMHVDLYMGDNPKSPDVYVIDEKDRSTGEFRQHKVMAGFDSERDAFAAYVQTSSKGPETVGGITKMSVPDLKAWLKTDTTKPLKKGAESTTVTLYRGHKGDGNSALGKPTGHTFWSPNEDTAKMYAGKSGVVTKQDHTFNNLLSAANWQEAKQKLGLPKTASMGELQDAAAAAGHDAITFMTGRGPQRGPGGRSYEGLKEQEYIVLKKMPASSTHVSEDAGGPLTEADAATSVPKVAPQEPVGAQSPSAAATPTTKKPTVRSDEPTNLLQFIAANGGVKPDGDLRAMDAHKQRVQIPGRKGFFGLVKADGHSPDVMRRMAQEAGFMPADKPDAVSTSSVRDFYNLIKDGLRGQHTISEEELDKETKRQKQTRAESSAVAREKALGEAADDILAEYPDSPPDLLDLAARIMVDERQTDIDTAVERAAMRLVADDTDYGVTPDQIADTFGEGAIDAVRAEPTSEDGEPAPQERDERGRPDEEVEEAGDGEDVPRAGAEVVQEEKPAEVADADWWNGLNESDRNNLRFSADLPSKFKTEQPWDKIPIAARAKISAQRPEHDRRKAEWDAERAAEAVEWEKDRAAAEALVERRPDEGRAEYYGRVIDGYYEFDDNRPAHQIVRDALGGYVDVEHLPIPMPKGALRNVDIQISKTPIGYSTGTSHDFSGFSGAGAAAGIWPDTIDGELGYHETRDDAIRHAGAELIRRFTFDETRGDVPATIKKAAKAGIGIVEDFIHDNTTPPTTDKTEAGEQAVLPGAEKIGDGELAQRKTDTGLKPKVAQKPTDIGLFGDEKDQTDLLDIRPTAAQHQAVEDLLGADADKVAPVDVARAAELLAENEGMEPATAFQHAVIENAVEQGFITAEQAEEAYGEEVKDVLESDSEGAHRSGGDVGQERTAPDEISARGAEEAGELPGSGQDREGVTAEGGTDSEVGGTAADAASGDEALGDETGDTAQHEPAAEGADKPIVTPLNDDFGNYSLQNGSRLVSVNGRDLAPSPKFDDSTSRKRNLSITRQRAWLVDEAAKEAAAQGDDFMARMFGGMNPSNFSRSDFDTVNDYLFGDPNGPTAQKEATNGVPGALRDGDAAASAEDVQPADTLGGTGSASEREVPGSEPDVRGPDEGRAEGAGRVSEGAGSVGGGRAGARGADRVSGERADDAPDRRAKRDAQQAAGSVEGENYAIEPGSLGEDRSFRVKADDNIRALELAHEIVAADRPATHEEQRLLARYVGWGGIKGAFPDADGNLAKGYVEVGTRLKEILSPDEYDTARRSIQYAHYTAEDVVRSMWSAVQRLGFKQGQVFEPGMGVGNFAGMMPGDVAANSHYQGLELDHTTARIAKLLYPKYGVRQQDFTKAPLPENAYDLVIGNPPFADVAIKSDPKYKQGFLLHDYFFAKSLDAVRPGGLLAFVTSAGTLNKIDTSAREYMADRADFVGAIRLPGDAFKENAGTEVTTDIIFLRKRLPGEAQGDRTWIETAEVTMPNRTGQDIRGNTNRYFAEHPDMVLGEQGFFDKLYENRYAVRSRKGVDFKAALEEAIGKLPVNVMSDWQTDNAGHAEHDFETTEKKEGTFYLGPNGVLHHMQSGVGKPVERRGKGVEGGKSEADIARIKGLIPIRDSLRAVYAADLAGNTAAADKARAALNKTYDDFVEKFGPINKSVIQTRRPTVIQQESARMEAREEARYASLPFKEGTFDARPMIELGASLAAIAKARNEARAAAQAAGKPFDEGQFDIDEIPDTIIDKRPNVDPFMDDPESYRLRAIERYDDNSGKAFKSPVFSENIITRERIPEINSINDALLYSLSQFGRVNVPAMAELSKKSEKEVIDELGEQVFLLPGTRDVYQTNDEYLSGDVRKKLAIAQAAAEKNPELRRNVAALEAAQPAPLAPSQIFANLGMPWLPPNIIKQFGTEELGLESLKVQYVPAMAQWIVSGDTDSVAASTTWGTADRRAPALLSDALNRVTTKIYDTVFIDNQKKSVLNTDKTQAAQDKVLAIREKFGDWIWRDQASADDLAALYNEKYNNLVVREYDGSYLTTPGVASNWKWRPHQKRVIARIIQSGNTYAAHAVGAGKTSEFIGAVMEMRRLGLVRKPMITVPNHMLAQFTKEFYEQYPTARLAIADERRFHTDRRKQFIANVATEDLDAVIITHSAFGMIPVSEDFANSIVRAEILQYRELLTTIEKGGEGRITRSRIENQIEKLEQRLIGKGNKRRDQVFTFEEMGVDHLTVDEAHLFRKLDFSTQMSNLKGVSPEGSQMAWDLYVKAQYLNTIRPGRGLVLGSGTPVTNTMAELYTVSRYLQPDVLAERGLEKFDAWAGAFGDQVSELEQDAAGNYKPVSRFAKFINVAELSAMVRQVMDVVTSKQLEQYVVRPKLIGGKRAMHLAEKGPALEAFQQGLAARMRKIEARKGPPKKGDDIMLSVINDGRHAAIDLRLVGLQNDPAHPSKLDLMIDNMFEIWKASKNQKFYKPGTNGAYEDKPATSGPATQMAFINLGLSGKRGFSVPDYIRAELVRRGVPKDEIAYIYDYPTSVAKQRLFNDMNEGKKRFLLGSTAKMATGVNAQRRLLAVHNLDPLWFPADDEQRNGRALRQGNMNREIGINDYSTKGTYDSTMWGMMAKKARFIQGFFEGDPSLRSMDDLGEASQYEQAKALTTNDPRLIKLTELKQDLERADRRKAAFDNEAYALRQRRANEKASAEHYTNRIAETKADIAQRVPTAGEAFKGKVGKTSFDKRVEFGEALYEALGKLEEKGTLNGGAKVAEVGGFPIYATVQQSNLRKGVHTDVFMSLNGEREREVKYELSSIGTVRSIEHILNNLDSDLAEYEQRKAKAEKFLTDSAEQTKAKFEGDGNIASLVQQVRELEAELKSTPAPDAPGTTENQAGAEIDPSTMADAAIDHMQPMTPERRGEVVNLVTAIMQHLVGNHVKVEFNDGLLPLPGKAGQDAYGKAAKRITGSRGLYSPMFHLVRLALIKGIDSAAFHEAYHGIEFQLQTPRERELMQRETERLRDYIKKQAIGLSAEEIDTLAGEEVRAIAFEHYATARSKNQPDPGRGLHIGVRHWFARLWENLQKLANGLRGLGFQTYEDIFNKAYRGDYAKASGATPREEANYTQEDDALASAMFDGASERVANIAQRAGYDGTELRTQIQDKFIRVKKAEQAAGGVPSSQSAYQAESLYYGRTGEQLERLEQDHLDPMIDDMKARDISLESMNDYLYAKHAPERNAAMDAINHPELMAGGRDLRGKGSGMSDQEAADIIEAIRASGKLADYEAVERRTRQIQNNTVDLMVSSGLISQETADAWRGAYDFYVPLQGFEEGTEDETVSGRGQGFDTRANETKKAFGRLSKAAGPLPFIMLQAEMAVIRAEKNRVGNTWLRFVRAHPDASRWTVDTAPKVKTIDHRTGLVTEISDPYWQDRSDVFVTKVGGRAVMIQHHGTEGKNLVRALKNVGTSNLNAPLKFMHALTTLQSRLATQWNPNFTVPNLVRDLGEAFINLQAQDQERFVRIFAKHLPGSIKGAFDALRGAQGSEYADAFREFDKAGGRIRFFGLDNPDDIGKSIAAKMRRLEGGAINNIRDAGAKAVEGFEVVNGAIENATRLAAYMAAREVGMSIPDSASLARELTVNFNRKGELGGAINALYMFSNAQIQGTVRMAQAMHNKRVRRAAYSLVAIGALAAMFSMMAGGDDDQGENYYTKIKPWIRDKHLILMWPKGYGHDGQYVKIPLPYGFSPFFVLGARTAAVIMGKEKISTAAGALLTSVFDAFNPLGEESASIFSLIPSVFRPVAHIQANKNWNGNPLYPSDDRSAKGIPDSEKSFKSNSEAAKVTARAVNSATGGSPYRSGWADWHPGSVDHVFETLTGGLGKFIKDVVMTGGALYKGEPFDANKAPIIRRFVGTAGDAAADAGSYYGMRDEARKNGGDAIKAAQKDRRAGNNTAAAEDFLRDNQNSARGEQVFKNADNQMKALRERENRIMNDKSMLADEREAGMKEVRSKMREVQNAARKRYMEIKGQPK